MRCTQLLQKYQRRKKLIDKNHYRDPARFAAALQVLIALKPKGMSSDESEIEESATGFQRKVFVCRERLWLSPLVSALLKALDSLAPSSNVKFQRGPAQLLRHQHGPNISKLPPIKGLPRNFYNLTWLRENYAGPFKSLLPTSELQIPQFVSFRIMFHQQNIQIALDSRYP